MKQIPTGRLVGLVLGFSTLTGAAAIAANRGVGVPKPEKNPISIREGSTKPLSSGRSSVRYFYGGGFRGGK